MTTLYCWDYQAPWSTGLCNGTSHCGAGEDSWTARRSNQSILKEISPEYSLEGPMLKLKLQYFGCLMWRTDSFEKTLMLERLKLGEGDDRGWDGWMVSPTQWTWVWVNSGSWWWTGKPLVLQFMGLQRVRHDWVTELKWTDKLSRKETLLWRRREQRNLTVFTMMWGRGKKKISSENV